MPFPARPSDDWRRFVACRARTPARRPDSRPPDPGVTVSRGGQSAPTSHPLTYRVLNRFSEHVATRRATISDVARAAGVSKSAVSFALNGREGIAETTRTRILSVAAEIGFAPSVRARALTSSRASAVGLVIARPPETLGSDPFFAVFVAGIETVLSRRGYALVLQVVPAGVSEADAYRRLAAEGRIDGAFLTDLLVEDPRPDLLRELGMPAVRVAPAGGHPTPSVVVDDRPGISAAVHHLADLGHERIAHVGGPQAYVHGVSRRAAWQQALTQRGLPAGTFVEADFSAQGGADATKALLDLDAADRPTAIVYANDLMAAAGLSVAAGRGVRVSDDLSITGFDDTDVSAHLVPGLTTVRTDALTWGAEAASVLLRLVGEGQPQGGGKRRVRDEAPIPSPDRPLANGRPSDVHLAPPTLVVRASTARAPLNRSTPGRSQ